VRRLVPLSMARVCVARSRSHPAVHGRCAAWRLMQSGEARPREKEPTTSQLELSQRRVIHQDEQPSALLQVLPLLTPVLQNSAPGGRGGSVAAPPSPSETRRNCGEVLVGGTRLRSHESADGNRATVSVASVATACTIVFDDGGQLVDAGCWRRRLNLTGIETRLAGSYVLYAHGSWKGSMPKVDAN